uniref:Uncharacterized protein n=1 Tax=Romanomermis culicivorax TaxID=13658 RepID=A0A915INF1_ROMCU
MRYKRKRSQNG